jgi:Transcriptional regulators
MLENQKSFDNENLKTKNTINLILKDTLNSMAKVEEISIKQAQNVNLSTSEIHTLEAIGIGKRRSMSEVAGKLKVTISTLTIAVNRLVFKGFVERYRSMSDKRVVMIKLTNKGAKLVHAHNEFHRRMINKTVEGLDEREVEVLTLAILKLRDTVLS